MKLLILGASGGCGKWIVQLAKERNYKVKAIARKETTFKLSENCEVIRGSVLAEEILKRGFEGTDAVLSALGIKRKNSLNPWSSLTSPDDLTTRAAEILIDLIPKFGVNRFIGISAGGVRESFRQVHPVIKWVISNSNIKKSYQDLAEMESIFARSDLDWMSVRPVTLLNGEPTGRTKQTNHYGLLDTIKRADVATWMLDKVEQTEVFSNRTPMITSG
ncbi:MAG: NAD(P)H-binding protein [Balneolaceae bacterium]|nr:NAD(P)H-binding protein [Balneolaceae bacterium]MDR9408654.1 NAD(P)H-binding protein [Balneolaceae bacterium]